MSHQPYECPRGHVGPSHREGPCGSPFQSGAGASAPGGAAPIGDSLRHARRHASARQIWREPDEELDEELDEEPGDFRAERPGDRDERALHSATRRAAGRERLTPGTPGGHRDRAWGGALRRMTVGGVTPSREDEHRFISVPGRYVPVGFARYVAPLVDPYDYEMYRVAGWRVAVPRTIPGSRVSDLLRRIYYYGPQSAGYVRLGDTMVPAILDTGDRMTLAETAVEFEPYPLSP